MAHRKDRLPSALSSLLPVKRLLLTLFFRRLPFLTEASDEGNLLQYPHSHTQTVMDLTNMPVYLHPESGFHTLALLLKNVTVLYNQGQSALFLLLKAL